MTAREDPLGIDDFERWWRVRERADIVRLVGALDPPSGAAGEAPAAALRDAKRSLMKQGFPSPYYWAPFQMFTVVLD